MAVTGHLTLCTTATMVVAALCAPGVSAQGFFGSAGVSVDQGYESNLFATPDGFGPGASDMIMRVGPSVEAGYRSRQVDLIGRYTLAAERFNQHTNLNTDVGQQDGRLELGYWPTRQLALGAAVVYVETNAPHELPSLSGALIHGRLPAHHLSATPAMTYDINPSWSVAAEYEFTREALDTRADNEIHAPRLGIEWRIDPRHTWRFLYRARRFGPPDAVPELSQTWVVGWKRELSRFAEVELQAGPRLFEDEVRPELSAAIRRRLRRGDVFLQASQSEMSMLGARGIMNTRSVRAGLTWNLARYVRLSATPSIFHTWRDGVSGTVRAVEFETVTYVARGVSFAVTGVAARQRGNFGGPVESVPAFSIQAGVRVLFPGRPREDMARDDDERPDPESDRQPPGAGAR